MENQEVLENEQLMPEEIEESWAVNELPSSLDREDFFGSESGYREFKSDNTSLEIKITPNVILQFKEVLSLGSEYIDIVAEDNTCIIACDYKGFITSGRFGLERAVTGMNIRLPVQIARQVTEKYGRMRIFVKDKLDIFFYKKDMNTEPLRIIADKSICYLDYFGIIKYMYDQGDSFGNIEELPKSMDALSYIYKISSGLKENGLQIVDGVATIDDSEYKFFSNLGIKGMNIVIPKHIMRSLYYNKNSKNGKFEIYNGYCVYRCGQIGYCWRVVKTGKLRSYEEFKSRKPLYACTVNLSEGLEFIRNLKIADNREQFLFLDFDEKVISLTEDGRLEYKIPLKIDNFYLMNPEDNSEKRVCLPIRELLSIMKELGTSIVALAMYDKFMCVKDIKIIENIGSLESNYLIKYKKGVK